MDHPDPDGGQRLHTETEGEGPRLVLLHGFTQTGRLWGPFAARLGRDRQLVRVDLPGHGGSSAVRADLATTGALVVAAGGPGPFDLLGYSLGARVALHAALAAPRLVRRLVLLAATPGIADPTSRDQRRAGDDALADDLESSGDVSGFLERWLAGPLFAGLPAQVAGLDERARNSAGGLAASLRLAGTGTQAPLWDRLGELTMPTLLVVGADDHRFGATAVAMAAGLPAAALSVVPGAGHAAHLHQPAVTARVVDHWLEHVAIATPGP